MNQLAQNKTQTTVETESATLPELGEVEALGNDLRRILVRSEQVLLKGETRDNVEQLERWVESCRRGITAAQKITDNGPVMLRQTRDQLKLSLDELLRLEDEGGNPPVKGQFSESEELMNAIRRIDHLIPLLEQSFQLSKLCNPL